MAGHAEKSILRYCGLEQSQRQLILCPDNLNVVDAQFTTAIANEPLERLGRYRQRHERGFYTAFSRLREPGHSIICSPARSNYISIARGREARTSILNDLSHEPEGSGNQKSARSGGKKSQSKKAQSTRQEVPSAEQCLLTIAMLGPQVAMGLLTIAQADLIRGTYTEILRYHERQDSGPSRTVDDQKLARVLPKCPKAGSLLLGFVQFAAVCAAVECQHDRGTLRVP